MSAGDVLRSLSIAALLGGALGTVRAQESDDVLGRATRDELTRSMRELRLANFERPYFIAYQVSDVETVTASATGGSLVNSGAHRRRMLGVEVRVGDYAFDNSNFMGDIASFAMGRLGDTESPLSRSELPLDEDYTEIRRKLWLATDAAYKEAAEQLAQKRAARLNRARGDTLPDFTRETSTQTIDDRRIPSARLTDAEVLVRELSRIRQLADMRSSSVDLRLTTTRTRYVNSEGTVYVATRPLVMLSAEASLQAADGTPLSASMSLFATALDSLPPPAQIEAQIRALASRLDSLRAAPVLDRYSGPILFEGRAAAELFEEVLAPAILARRSVSGAPEMEMMIRMRTGRGGGSLGDKLGSRVMPGFMSVVDDPTISVRDGVRLMGSYKVDDEGVPGRRKIVIEGGMLRSLLSTRVPVDGVPRSTGNRRGPGPAPSNLIVESRGGVSDRELRTRLISLVKQRGLPFGVIIRELGENVGSMEDDPVVFIGVMRGPAVEERSVFRAYRVFPDGREELVRAGRLTGLDPVAFRDIVAVSTTSTIHHATVVPRFDMPMWFGFGFAPLSLPVSSYVVPSLLFEDVAVTRPARETPTLPLIPPPARAP